ncbi:MAG: hypothetical protein WAJ94_00285 [Candidatus Cybelea sp.]
MSVTHLQKWDVTAIEIALDLEMLHFVDPNRFVFSGPAEPRICLVAGFALTSQLKRVVAAVNRAVPARPPSRLRIAPAAARAAVPSLGVPVSVQPMPALLRLQSKLIRAIEPGLAHEVFSLRVKRAMDDGPARFIGGFISAKTLPSFEPSSAAADFEVMELTVIGITIYRLDQRGAPTSILGHWAYPADPGSVHLRGGP